MTSAIPYLEEPPAMNEAPELLPCPFCGCTDVSNNDDGDHQWYECDWCHATSGFDPEPQFEGNHPSFHWNRRTPIAAGSGEATKADTDRLTAALVALARHNIPVDVQELLVQGNPMRSIAPGALEAALPPMVSAGRITKADRFYGDPVVRFRAMANATYSTDHIDGAHFRMWCAIAANEIETLRASLSRKTAGEAVPVAWRGVVDGRTAFLCWTRDEIDRLASDYNATIEPLFASPPLPDTEEKRS